MHGSAEKHKPEDGSGELAYRVPEAARLIGLKARKTWELVHSGEIDSIKVGSARIVTRAALERYLAKREREQREQRDKDQAA